MEASRIELLGKFTYYLANVYEYCYHGGLQPRQVITKISELLEIPRNGVCINQFEDTRFAHADLASAAMHIASVISGDSISNEHIQHAIDFLKSAGESLPHCIYSLSLGRPSLEKQICIRQEELNCLFGAS